MPLVIEELTVQVEVNQGSKPGSAQTGQNATAAAAASQADLVRQCVEEVMEVLRHQNER